MGNEIKMFSVVWKDPESTMQIKQKYEKTTCLHPRVEFDVDSRTVFCAVCGNQIDAFDFLISLSLEESRQIRKIKSLNEEITKLDKKLAKLKKEFK